MGNPAIPSKACQPCRVKRRKCDKKQPGCSQCWRAQIDCPGYRDDFALRLRDQTGSTALKAQSLRKGSKPAVLADPLVIENPSLCPEQSALGYFIMVYAPTAMFHYLPETPAEFLGGDSLSAALLAPALLMLSQNFRLTALQPLAQKHYATALRSTSVALSSKELVTHDSTLLAVLLLGLYEALAFRGRRATSSWDAHVTGAIQLLQLRGRRQFETPLGQRLFLHASGNIKIDCAQKGIKEPTSVVALQEGLVGRMNPLDPNVQISNFLGRFITLRVMTGVSPAIDCLHKALELDQELASMLDGLWRLAPYENVDVTSLPKHIRAYQACVHRHKSQRMVKLWNAVRILRLFLHQHIYAYLTIPQMLGSIKSKWLSELREHTSMIGTKTIVDTLASVPLTIEGSRHSAVSARTLIYPLTSIAVSTLASPSASQYARDHLAWIGRQYGLVQADDSTHMVSQTTYLEDCKTDIELGSSLRNTHSPKSMLEQNAFVSRSAQMCYYKARRV
ncbi:uncharacterized protein N7459_001660 [Penicillium hispanicum]|uniref:uncharacterized protein n=1 Tax=Penicillium hispanicum TaxID=1080232 RepID=UPI002540002E|nr:uncharacterized protein N7459_001660 [Penicillium hispanicum]KAJ5595452.1 hypothetical protein N7459_001660 [Penicillium hispanicum]